MRLAGTAALALPFGAAARATPATAPTRLVLWPSLNGARPDLFWPSGGGGSLVTEPLAAFRDRMTFVRGIGIEGSENHYAVRSMFSGSPISDYGAADPTRASLDQLVADAIDASAPTAERSIHLGVIPADAIEFYQLYGRSTFFFGPAPVDYEANPVSAFDRLLSGLDAPTNPPPPMATSEDAMRAAVLNVTLAETAALQARAVDVASERHKLEVHAAALERMRAEGGNPIGTPLPPAQCNSSPLASVEALRSELQGNDRAAYRHELFDGLFDAQVDVLARSLVCGLTRVGTLQAGSADGNVVVPVEGGHPHHDTSHGDQELFGRMQRWYATKFARLLSQLDVPDPLCPEGRTVLDNSCVLWLSECLPSSHASGEVPCLLVGGAGGSLVTGTQITASGATNRTLLKTLAGVYGVSDDASAHLGSTRITELLA